MVEGPLLFDTNVLIYALNGTRETAMRLIASRTDHAVSLITWMEILVGHPQGAEVETKRFLATFQVLETSREIARQAVDLRRASGTKLPDAVIYATALVTERTLVTYNSRDFGKFDKAVYIPEA